jgi:LCP family protein required for cell wall assembly
VQVAGQTYRSAALDAPPPPQPPRKPPTPGRRPPRRRDPLWARICVVVGALLMMASGGVIVAGKLLLGRATSSVTRQNLLGDAGVRGAANIGGAIDILMVGLDQRPATPEEQVRADTIVILHVPASHDQAYLVSLPRDTRVRIPQYDKTGFRGATDRINSAFAYGYEGSGTEQEKRARGVELLAHTIRDLTGIQFKAAAIIDFVGFEAVLKELGGVTMCIERRAESIHLAQNSAGNIVRVWYDDVAGKVRGIPTGYHPVVYEPGCNQRLDAIHALDYARIRKGECCPNGDYDRQRHQQQLLKAIMKESTSTGVLTDPRKLLRVTQAAGKAFILDTQGVPIEDFVFTLKSVTSNSLILVKTNAGRINTIPGTAEEMLSEDSIQMLRAVRDGRLLDFLATHPEFVAPAG